MQSEMLGFVQSITEDELRFISNLDYGNGAAEHFEALKKVIFLQSGVANYDQSWYPSEVYELGSNWLQDGHEREFTICTLLVILNVIGGNDSHTDLSDKFSSHAAEYQRLPERYQQLVLKAYEQAGI